MTRTTIYHWLLAARPKTLGASIAPVLIGTTMAYRNGHAHFLIAIVTFLAAVAIQVGANFANDYFDFKNGVDSVFRLGPRRMTQEGLIDPLHMRNAFVITFLIAVMLGFILLIRGGAPIFLIGVFSIMCGILYAGGPHPLGHHGLGDVLVLMFFGPVAVGGTYYLQTLHTEPIVILVGFIPGLMSTAILAVNNLRDIQSDGKTGKRTLAVMFGEDFAKREYFWCISGACLISVIIVPLTWAHPYMLIASGIVYALALPIFRRVYHGPIDKSLNSTLAATSFLLTLYAILFAICW